MKKLAVLFIIALLCIGCSVNPSKVEKDQAEKFVDQITYIKDSDYWSLLCSSGHQKSWRYSPKRHWYGLCTL